MVVLCCETHGAADVAARNKLLNTGRCLIFASAFTRNEHLVQIDFSKTTVGWGAGIIEFKIRYFHLKDRVKVGLMLDKNYMSAGMIMVMKDTSTVEYISISFYDYPMVDLDYLFNLSTKFKAKIILQPNDKLSHLVLDNYLKYE